jgi:hypothetical protein
VKLQNAIVMTITNVPLMSAILNLDVFMFQKLVMITTNVPLILVMLNLDAKTLQLLVMMELTVLKIAAT